MSVKYAVKVGFLRIVPLPEVIIRGGFKMFFVFAKPRLVNAALVIKIPYRRHYRGVTVVFVSLVERVVFVLRHKVGNALPVRYFKAQGRVIKHFVQFADGGAYAVEIAGVRDFDKHSSRVARPDVRAV